ncbi:MAG TPA: FecR family protein, partial [Parapedobacter sp.]|nr:FecR family protein [Parapedobacter sp.]
TPSPQGNTDRLFEKHLARHAETISFTDQQPAKPGQTPRIWAIRVMAAAIMFAVLTIAYLALDKDTITNSSHPSGFVEYIAEKGIKKQITLPDGSTAWLNSGSRISYPANFGSGKTRPVRLEGEAFFDVVKNKNKPFTIATDKITIKVLGTSFNVKAYPEEAETETTLITGEIELSVNERPSEKILMKPNEKVAVISAPKATDGTGSESKQLTVTIGSVSKVLVADKEYIKEASWKDNKLIFRNEPFNELLVKLERWYGVDFTLENNEIGNYRFNGTIARESLTQTLDALQLIHFFNYKIEDHDVIIH